MSLITGSLKMFLTEEHSSITIAISKFIINSKNPDKQDFPISERNV